MDYTELRLAGIDVDELMERLMNNASLVKLLIKKFAEDANFGALCAAFANGDAHGAESASHTLKGMCGNMSMKVLYELFSTQVSLLRSGDSAGAEAMMAQITEEYNNTVNHINLWLANG